MPYAKYAEKPKKLSYATAAEETGANYLRDTWIDSSTTVTVPATGKYLIHYSGYIQNQNQYYHAISNPPQIDRIGSVVLYNLTNSMYLDFIYTAFNIVKDISGNNYYYSYEPHVISQSIIRDLTAGHQLT